jgi:DNA modification methylase
MNDYRIITGDCITGMKTLPDGCVHTCITSPPYFGLRDYRGGAKEIGCEASPEEFVHKMVEVFREVRRVLRDDGTLWLNLGDSYASNGCYINSWLQKEHNKDKKHLHTNNHERYEDRKAFRGGEYGIKAKDLMGIPWRVALALQADGWYLRQDIIWHKPNPMPESVEDRCTKAHEYIFMLTKQPKYYYDHEAVKEPLADSSHGNGRADGKKNKRSVWTVNTKGYKGAHFAVYPENLIVPCVLAATSAHGCCSKCGTPWKRQTAKPTQNGWVQQCTCKDAKVVPCTVFDPFTGSGTTAVVALKNGRDFLGCELNLDYVKIAEERIKESVPQTLEEVFSKQGDYT